MDLDLTWEQKALIGVGILTIFILIYAYGPFNFNSEGPVQNQSYSPSQEPQLVPVNLPSNNSNSSNGTINNTNVTITMQKAKEIASEPGYTTGEPNSGSIIINNGTVSVWIVPLSKNNKVEKEVYINSANGNIVATKDF